MDIFLDISCQRSKAYMNMPTFYTITATNPYNKYKSFFRKVLTKVQKLFYFILINALKEIIQNDNQTIVIKLTEIKKEL